MSRSAVRPTRRREPARARSDKARLYRIAMQEPGQARPCFFHPRDWRGSCPATTALPGRPTAEAGSLRSLGRAFIKHPPAGASGWAGVIDHIQSHPMNRVSEDEKRGTGFSSEETRSLWKHRTIAEGHAACYISYRRLQAACASASQHAPDQAEVTTSSIIDLISHLVVAEAVDLDGLRAQLRRTARAHRSPPARGGRSLRAETFLLESQHGDKYPHRLATACPWPRL